jgi:hypothetical protein
LGHAEISLAEKRKTMTRAKGLLMGVIPKYQNLGIESAFIHNLSGFSGINLITRKLSFHGLQTLIRDEKNICCCRMCAC